MSIMIRVWDLWVRLEKYVNQYLGERVHKILQQREIDEADAFLKEFRANLCQSLGIKSHELYQPYKAPTRPNCTHLKGYNGRRVRFQRTEDYNLGQHTFSDGRTKIWCLFGCGLEAWNGDENFNNLQKLVGQSSNTPSASERIASGHKDTEKVIVTVQDEVPNVRA